MLITLKYTTNNDSLQWPKSLSVMLKIVVVNIFQAWFAGSATTSNTITDDRVSRFHTIWLWVYLWSEFCFSKFTPFTGPSRRWIHHRLLLNLDTGTFSHIHVQTRVVTNHDGRSDFHFVVQRYPTYIVD